MLSISESKKAGGAVSYFSDHLVKEGAVNATEDYYTHGEAGQWLGQGAQALGLEGEVTAEAFGRALLAINNDGEALVSNGGAAGRRAGWDLTFSAPKSVSTLWAAGDDQLREAIRQAQSDSVIKAMRWLQSDGGICGRRGKGGVELENVKLVASLFDHATSREQDPQLHTHAFTFNLAQRNDGTWGAIQSREFMVRKMATGAIYRAALASEMQKLGFSVEQKPKGLFEIKDVNQDLQKNWSKRRQQVVEKMAEHGGLSAKSAEAAALATRSKKESTNQEQLNDRWKEEAASFGVTPESINQLRSGEKTKLNIESVENLWLELTQQESTLGQHKLAAKIFERSAGALSADDAQQFLQDFIKDENTVILRDHSGNRRFTSREMFELEQSIIDSAKTRQNESHALSSDVINTALSKVPTISEEQRNMVEHVTNCSGVVIVEGAAGTGKTFALAVANDAWATAGKNVIGAALAGKAAEGLQDGSKIKSQTLHSLLIELNANPDTNQPAKRKLSSRDVIVLDEAGMIGSRQMADLLEKAAMAGAKVVLVGDSAQLQPIDAGGSFRGLSKALGAAELKDIRRQRSGWHKEAVIAFSEGDAGKALQLFKERDLLITGQNHDETIKKMVTAWAKDPNKSEDKLMLAGTRADVAKLNHVARLAIKDTLTGDIATISGKDFQCNDRILFTANSKKLGVKNGSLGRVVYSDPETNLLTVKLDSSDRMVSINPEIYDAVDHGYSMTVHRSQGVTTEAAFVLANEYMSSQEWSYVAMSRSKGNTTIFADSDLVSELDQTMSKSQSKELSTDFELE